MKKLTSVLLLLFSGLAQAIPVTWQFKDVLLADGGSIEGSFKWDAEAALASDIDIYSTAGSAFSGAYYSSCQGGQCISGQTEPNPRFIFTGTDTLPALFVEFNEPLMEAGGTVSIVTGTCIQSCENWGIGLSRNVVSGQLTTIPIPSPVWLLGSAVTWLIWQKRTQVDHSSPS